MASVTSKGLETYRLTIPLTKEEMERLTYWADKAGLSKNEFFSVAMERYINIETGNYELEPLAMARYNQLKDAVYALGNNADSLNAMLSEAFSVWLNLAKGDGDYLLENRETEF